MIFAKAVGSVGDDGVERITTQAAFRHPGNPAAKPERKRVPAIGEIDDRLHSLGIDLALHQQGIDTTTPAGKAMFQMMGVFAEFERSMIVERVRSGVAP